MFCVSHFRGALSFGASALLEQKIAFVYAKCSRRVRLQHCLAAVLQRLVWLQMCVFAVLSIALKFPCPEVCDGVCSLQMPLQVSYLGFGASCVVAGRMGL